MNLDDLRRLNFRDIGNWPLLPKALAARHRCSSRSWPAARCLDWKDQYDALDRRGSEEAKLKEQYAQKKAKAINFELYAQQLREIEQSFGALLKQLPNKSEMDALLTDINQAGLGRGLQFELFKPAAPEKMADFYAELPINDQDHRQLPRHGRVRERRRATAAHRHAERRRRSTTTRACSSMDAVAKTFRYLDEEEIAKQRKAAKDAKDAKRRARNETLA